VYQLQRWPQNSNRNNETPPFVPDKKLECQKEKGKLSFGPFGVTTPQSPSNPKHKQTPKHSKPHKPKKEEDVPKQTPTTTNKKTQTHGHTHITNSSGPQRFDA